MSLVERAKEGVDNRLRWLLEAHEAQKAVAKLPEPIQELNGTADCNSRYELTVDLYGDEAFEVCKANGVEFGEPEMNTYSGVFHVQGKFGYVDFTINRISKPVYCEVIKVPFAAMKYESRCTEQTPDPTTTNGTP